MRLLLWMVLLQMFNNCVECSEGNMEKENNDEKAVFVEILVIVDKALNLKIASENVNTTDFIQAIFSFANMFYSNIRPKIEITISNILVENENYGPLPFIKPTLDPGRLLDVTTLMDMAHWNSKNTESADVVVAMTGLDLCSYQKLTNAVIDGRFFETYHDCNRSTLGMAYVGGTCNQSINLAIVEVIIGDYFMTAATAAHEIGHLLNLTHDGEIIKNELWCNASDQQMMSPSTNWNNQTHFTFSKQIANGNLWSECSKEQFRRYLTNFKCLQNKPEEEMYPLDSPSIIFEYLLNHLGLFWNLDGWFLFFGYLIGNNSFFQHVQCMWSYYMVILYYFKYRHRRNLNASEGINEDIMPCIYAIVWE